MKNFTCWDQKYVYPPIWEGKPEQPEAIARGQEKFLAIHELKERYRIKPTGVAIST